MDELILNMVQGQTGYSFNNPDLLYQAFTRRSYTEENGGENNEVLEFIGDKALDFAVIKLLISKFGSMKNGDSADGTKSQKWPRNIFDQNNSSSINFANEFCCTQNEGELTTIKSQLVEKKNLARCVDKMGWAKYLRTGKSDIKTGAINEPSVKEDLFEAVVGAVTIDCGWDFNKIQSVVEAMLILEDFLADGKDKNYIRMIYNWEEHTNHCLPWFWFKEQSYESTWYTRNPEVIYQQVTTTPEVPYFKYRFSCELKLLDNLPVFCGFGTSKSEARMNVCKLAYDYLCEHDYIHGPSIQDEIDNPNKADSINQLEILARRGYFSIPAYNFKQQYNKNGNSIWTCQCHIDEIEYHPEATSSSKKDAKKTAAFDMLMYVLNCKDN